MSKRFEQTAQQRLIQAVEQKAGQQYATDIIEDVVHGADEADLVNSGLEEAMIGADSEIGELRDQRNTDLRTAALLNQFLLTNLGNT